MKILITGATGLIGSALVQLLLKNKHSIHYLTTSPRKILNKANYTGFLWDIKAQTIEKKCIEGVDAIIHLAGASISKRWTTAYKKELLSSRVDSARLLYQLLEKNPHQVKHFVSASGTAIYPNSFENTYTEKSSQIDTTFLGTIVTDWEKSADQFKKLGIKVTKMRTGIVFANQGGALPEMVRPIRFFVGSGFGSGQQQQAWIHLTDVVNLYEFVLKNNIDGVVNAVAPDVINNQN